MSVKLKYIAEPAAGAKFLTVKELLEFADRLRKDEVPTDQTVCVSGLLGWGNELRGIGVKGA